MPTNKRQKVSRWGWGWGSLTTEVLPSPVHGIALAGAHVGVGGDGCAQTLAVPAKVTPA